MVLSKYEQSQYELAVTVSTPLQSSLLFTVSSLLSYADITTLHFCLPELTHRCYQNCKKRRRECRKSARVQTQLSSQEFALGNYWLTSTYITDNSQVDKWDSCFSSIILRYFEGWLWQSGGWGSIDDVKTSTLYLFCSIFHFHY